jgi:thiosulfate reductase cytochrome b subunit
LTHWTNAAAMTVMIGSGWQIYNASPLFPFVVPARLTLGHWLGGALAGHFAAMWLLAGNFAIYVGYGLVSGHIRRRLFPLSRREIRRDAALALRFRLPHDAARYNAVQRLLYVLAGAGIALAIASGLAIWKPVQLYPLTFVLGGYEIARRVHFLAMAGIVAFIAVHLILVAIVPRTLRPMLTGRV